MVETRIIAVLFIVLAIGACTAGSGSIVAEGMGQARDRMRRSVGELVDILKAAEPHDRRWLASEAARVLEQRGCWWTADGLACTDWGDSR